MNKSNIKAASSTVNQGQWEKVRQSKCDSFHWLLITINFYVAYEKVLIHLVNKIVLKKCMPIRFNIFSSWPGEQKI